MMIIRPDIYGEGEKVVQGGIEVVKNVVANGTVLALIMGLIFTGILIIKE